MTYNIFYTSAAENDLHGIYEYIAHSLLNPGAANHQIKAILGAVSNLKENPLRFPLYKSEPWHSKGLRFLPINNYIVFYLPETNTKNIYIIRIMYGKRDIDKQLNSEK